MTEKRVCANCGEQALVREYSSVIPEWYIWVCKNCDEDDAPEPFREGWDESD